MCIKRRPQGVGETRNPMRVSILANLVNAAFNYLLIYGHLGFPGLKSGGGHRQRDWPGGGLVMSLRAVLKEDDSYLRIRLRDNWRLDRDTMAAILKVGGNAAVEQASMRIGFSCIPGSSIPWGRHVRGPQHRHAVPSSPSPPPMAWRWPPPPWWGRTWAKSART